jgi:hypothetical protein
MGEIVSMVCAIGYPLSVDGQATGLTNSVTESQ